MSDFLTIEIDVDVHKRIEAARRSFGETQNELLRRLLAIDGVEKSSAREGHVAGATRSWFGKGLDLPHGTQVRMEYNGRVHSGVIQDGKWAVEGGRFGSPSAAAGAVARTKGGDKTSLDGWIYWWAKLPGSDEFQRISELRPGRKPKRTSIREPKIVLQHPLDLPTESAVIEFLEHFLAQQSRSISLSEAYAAVGDHFQLTAEQRHREMPNGEVHIENRVRQARRKLVNAGKMDLSAGHGRWRLKN